MFSYYYETYNCYGHDTMYIVQDVKCPKAPKKLGRKRRYNDTTIPPLDFRSCSESPVWL